MSSNEKTMAPKTKKASFATPPPSIPAKDI